MAIPMIEAQRVVSELETMGLKRDPSRIGEPGAGLGGIWYTQMEKYTGKKLVKLYRKDTGKVATVYNISGGIILLYGEA